MLAIRMQRKGRKGLPLYRIVVQDARRHPLSGAVVAEVGSYDPHTKRTVLDTEKIETYLKNGAQPSSRVVKLLSDNKVKLPKWVKMPTVKTAKAKRADKLRKNQLGGEAAPVEEAPAVEESMETPAETPAAPEEAVATPEAEATEAEIPAAE